MDIFKEGVFSLKVWEPLTLPTSMVLLKNRFVVNVLLLLVFIFLAFSSRYALYTVPVNFLKQCTIYYCFESQMKHVKHCVSS